MLYTRLCICIYIYVRLYTIQVNYEAYSHLPRTYIKVIHKLSASLFVVRPVFEIINHLDERDVDIFLLLMKQSVCITILQFEIKSFKFDYFRRKYVHMPTHTNLSVRMRRSHIVPDLNLRIGTFFV